jgi:ligand-binding SRPBCC domain-containing protein
VALGEMSALVVQGQRVSSEKIVKHGFKFKYEHLEKALADICLPLLSGQKEFFSEVWIPQKVNQVFPFFSDEKNLEKLTPSSLNFQVLKKSTERMQAGTLIDYKLRVHGFPLRWRTLIESWSPDKSFVDTQLKGPYKQWHHTHEFNEIYGGTLMRDRVKYQLPFGFLGNVFLADFIKSDIEKIFSYRKKIIAQLFGQPL